MRGGQRCVAIITNNIFYLRNIDDNVIRENAICNIYIKHCTDFTWNLYFSIFGENKLCLGDLLFRI